MDAPKSTFICTIGWSGVDDRGEGFAGQVVFQVESNYVQKLIVA
jgi:hypothetical protein